MNGDEVLVRQLRQMWSAGDPPPVDLADRVLFAVQLEDLEFELLHLQADLQPQAARAAETARTVTFASESLTVMLTVSDTGQQRRRLDGWIAPAAALRVELRASHGSKETTADHDGRFAFADLPEGLIQLVLHRTDGTDPDRSRPVVTPAIRL